MKPPAPNNEEIPACGYGLTGLCCSACLSGPCRISPFEPASDGGKCGASADQLVAGNLLRLIADETAVRLAKLARLVKKWRPALAGAAAADRPGAAFLAKYGLDGSGSPADEIDDLLSPDPTAAAISPLLGRLYPEAVFPQFYSAELLPTGSLTLTLLDAFRTGHLNAAPTEDLLHTCLTLSLVALIGEELSRDLQCLADPDLARRADRRQTQILETLARVSSPACILYFADAPQGPKPEAEALREKLEGPLIDLSQPVDLLDIARRFHGLRSSTPADSAPLVITLSASPVRVVGLLCCGYTVASCPGLPLSGSQRAVSFFCKELKDLTGSVYLPAAAGGLLPAARNYIRKMPCAS